MRQRTWQFLFFPAVVVVAVAAWRQVPSAQARDGDVLGALLTEVRGLRAAMEQMASAGPRIQLATARLQLSEQRINTLNRRLNDVHSTIQAMEAATAQRQERIARLEDALDEPNQPGRDDITREIASIKREIGRSGVEVQRLQAEEAQVSQEISIEQARWSDINNRLEELDRALMRK